MMFVVEELAQDVNSIFPEKGPAWAQRLGYLLKHLGFAAKTPALKEYVREHTKQSTTLLPKAPHKHSRRNRGWKLYVNADVEAEL